MGQVHCAKAVPQIVEKIVEHYNEVSYDQVFLLIFF
jgi:hypothetical protein